MMVPGAEEIADLIAFLDLRCFQQCAKQPLFAARYWNWELSQQARARYKAGQDNIHEVPIPRIYWRDLNSDMRDLYLYVSLGRLVPGLEDQAELAALRPREGQVSWVVLPRFGRYILASHPEQEGRDYVYFGDDTLYLMGQARQLLQGRARARVLDLCCGGGGVSLGLPEFEGQVVGVDLNPVAIELARSCARAQGLKNYEYQHGEAEHALEQKYDLIVGNPPTLSPTLTGREAFHATGSMELFLSILDKAEMSLADGGEALMTIFSVVDSEGNDTGFEQVRELLVGRRGFRYQVRRHFPIGEGRLLRHVALHLLPRGQDAELLPLARGLQLPALAWRRR